MKMFTVQEVADRLGVSTKTIYAAIDQGLLECYRLRARPETRGTIRISEGQVEQYLERSRAEPESPAPPVSLRDITFRGEPS